MHLVSLSHGAGIRLRRLRNLLETDQHTYDEQSDVIVSVIGEEICVAPRHNAADCVWTARWLTVASSFSSQAVQPRTRRKHGGPKQSVPRNHTLGHLSLSSDWPQRSDDCIEESQLETHLTGGVLKKTTNEPLAKARPPRCVRNNTEVLTASTLAGRLSRKVCLWSNK